MTVEDVHRGLRGTPHHWSQSGKDEERLVLPRRSRSAIRRHQRVYISETEQRPIIVEIIDETINDPAFPEKGEFLVSR